MFYQRIRPYFIYNESYCHWLFLNEIVLVKRSWVQYRQTPSSFPGQENSSSRFFRLKCHWTDLVGSVPFLLNKAVYLPHQYLISRNYQFLDVCPNHWIQASTRVRKIIFCANFKETWKNLVWSSNFEPWFRWCNQNNLTVCFKTIPRFSRMVFAETIFMLDLFQKMFDMTQYFLSFIDFNFGSWYTTYDS